MSLFRSLFPLSALLLGSAFLVFASGLNALILPVRGQIEGFSAFSLGVLGTGWALGYVAGCLATPSLVYRAGHIRAFCVMCALAAISVLLSLIFLSPSVWVPLRALSGFCFAGAVMIIESWINERTESDTRGKVFAIYSTIYLTATTGGQLVIITGDASGYIFFTIAAIIYCLALFPVALSATTTPSALVSVSINLKTLWQNSPIAVFSILMVGISNSAFGTLAAVYGAQQGLTTTIVVVFASLPILTGAAAQIPVGILSDKFDRRLVLIFVASIGLASDIAFIIGDVQSVTATLVIVAAFGTSVFAMYPIIVAHANDHAEPGTYIQISGGLLLVFGIGSVIGPTIAGGAMSVYGHISLFWTTGFAHLLLIIFVIARLSARAAVDEEDKVAFVITPMARGATPETATLAAEEDEQIDSALL